MGKYLSNCSGVVGVITRAKSRALATALSSSSSPMAVKKVKKASNNVSRLRNRPRIAVVSDENCRPDTAVIGPSYKSPSSEVVAVVVKSADCTGCDDVSGEFPASCCSRNDDASISNRIVADPEVQSAETTSSRHLNLDNCNNEERRERQVETVEPEKMVSPRKRSQSTVEIKMPSNSEIDSFFVAAEKELHKRFADRYNFDVVKDVALEGLYEWVAINP